jgi:hypothetical protein
MADGSGMSQHNHTLNLVMHWTVYDAVVLAFAGLAVAAARLAWARHDGTVDDRLVWAVLGLAFLGGAGALIGVFV